MVSIQKLHFLGYLLCSQVFHRPLNATCYSSSPELSLKLQPHMANCLQPLRLLPHEVTLPFPRTSGPIIHPLLFLSYMITVGSLPLPFKGFNYHLHATVTPLVPTCLLESVPNCLNLQMVGPSLQNPMHPNGTLDLFPYTMGSTFSASHSGEWQPYLPCFPSPKPGLTYRCPKSRIQSHQLIYFSPFV